MDIRVEKTRQSILNTFIELRGQKPLERITVKELCQRARINKSTFYAHYADIYDLADQVEEEIVKLVIANVAHPEYVIQRPKEFIREFYQAYMSHGALLKVVFSNSRSGNLIRSLQRELKAMVLSAYPQYRDDPVANVVLSYGIYGGYYALTENRDRDAEMVLEVVGELDRRAVEMIEGK